ncbi:MAG TPA: ABC transporter substrate-binding protein [Thermoanaerobaculia bacterium]|nr:ABC transporter substrate-binding protein [Thermoanaerobaculia bacterium]
MSRRRPVPARRLAAALLAAALAGATAVLLAGNAPSPRTRLKVVYGRYLTSAPLAIARAEGFFEAQGLDVEFVHLPSTADAMPALVQGEIDAGGGLIKVADFNAIARGAAVRVVADMGHDEAGPCVTAALVARPGFPEAKGKDGLRGARASATPLSYGEYVLETFVNSKGLKLADLQLSRLAAASAAEAVAGGSIDVTYLAEPFLSRAVGPGRAVVWTPLSGIVPEAQLGVLLYGPSLVKGDREAGRRLMAAYLQAMRQYNLGKTPRNVEIISKETGLDPEYLRKICWTSIDRDGRIRPDSLLGFQRWAVRKGLLDAVVPVDSFWDPSFLDAARRILGPSPR